MADAERLRLVVITPEKRVIDERASSVVIPAHDGELGILVGRAPIMCELGTGRLRYESGGRSHALLVDGGFAHVSRNHVTVLSGSVLGPEDIGPQRIAEADQAARAIAGSGDEAVEARARARRKVALMRAMQPPTPPPAI